MPDSNALLGFGVVYEIGDDALDPPTDWIEEAEVNQITPPNTQAADVEVTHMQSPNRTREYIAGLIEPGDASFGINWIPNDTTGQLMLSLKTSGERRSHRITWPNGVTWTFRAYVKGFEPSTPMDDKMTATVTCKVSASVVEAAGS